MKQFGLGVIGAVLGAFIPTASYQLSRYECKANPWMWVLVGGGFLFSSFTVFDWARTAFGHGVKAFGFVILTEGVLVFSHTFWLSVIGLAILVVLNALATASNMLRERDDVTDETPSASITTLGLTSYRPPLVKRPLKRGNSTKRVRAFRKRQRAQNVTPIETKVM